MFYVDYHIDQKGLHASAERLAGISNLKTPETKKALLSILASMNYNIQFIKGFAHKSALLWKMTSFDFSCSFKGSFIVHVIDSNCG